MEGKKSTRERSRSKEKKDSRYNSVRSVLADQIHDLEETVPNFEKLRSAFRTMPKGAELHVHYSSIVDYDEILRDILAQEALAQQLRFGYEHYRGQTSLILFFESERRENFRDIQSFAQHREGFFRKLRSKVEELQKRFSQTSRRAFELYHLLGSLFYTLIKSESYYRRYVDLVVAYLRANRVQHAEVRIKYDAETEAILEYVRGAEFRKMFRFIIQYNKTVKAWNIQKDLDNRRFREFAQ